MKRNNIVFVVCFVLILGGLGSWLFLRDGSVDQSGESSLEQVAVSLSEIKYPENRVEREAEGYFVKEGDTLESIAEDYELEVNSIIWASELVESEIEVGQELKIPPEDGVYVTVEEGDTIEKLSEEFRVEAQTITDCNWLDYPFELEIGSEIFLPGATK